jgi:hypothetical protein
MALPQEFFDSDSNLTDDLLDLSEVSDLSEAINAGDLDLSQFEDDEDLSMPQNTILGAPPVITRPVEASDAPPNENVLGPTKEDTQRLEKVESMLMAVEDQIKKLSDSLESTSDTTPQIKTDIMDELLSAPVDEKDNSTVKIVSQDMLPKVAPTTPSQQAALGEIEFNKERLVELTQQRELLVKERNNILKPSNYFNTTEIQQPGTAVGNTANTVNQSLENQTVEGNTNVDNIFKNINNISNTSDPPRPAAPILSTSAELPEQIASSPLSTIPDVSNSFENINTTDVTNNIANDNINSITEGPVDNQNTAFETENISSQNFSNINNAFTDTTNISQEKGTYESVLPPGNSTTAPLPSPENEVNLNAKNIVEILQGIKEGIVKLNDGLGTNFGNLNQSMQGLKASVVNNSYNNFSGGNNSTSQEAPNPQQRSIMPDYRGDYPQSNDFPAGFDLTKLGGTNLPNPQSIL